MKNEESKSYSWAWLTADRLLSQGACEIVFALLTASAGTADVTLYDGTDASGDKILTLEATANISQQIHLPKPIYCRKGLFVDVGSNVTGIFVQWRELGDNGGGS